MRNPLLDDDGFVRTISDDEAVSAADESDAGRSQNGQKGTKRKRDLGQEIVGNGLESTSDETMNPEFEFRITDFQDGVAEELWEDVDHVADHGPKKGVDIDALIARRRSKQPEIEEEEDDESDDLAKFSEDGSDDFGAEAELHSSSDAEDDTHEKNTLPSGDEQSESEAEVADEMPDASDDERAKRQAFFAPETPTTTTANSSFQDFNLSRPVLRGLAGLGFVQPTPIQRKTIPIAMLGKDVVGGAVTGSGKTAAFLVPIIERLLYRPKKVPTSRVAILMPTRELAVQCFTVAKKLAAFTDITFCQLVGGFSLREQEAVLRGRPDVIIATPGRFIDHMRNSASFTIDTLEILVLDEADRMLEDGFADELNEILTTIPHGRQTMLFSATMTDTVDKLIRVGLQRPVRLMVDARKQTVGTLTQEFVRLRAGREHMRLGYLMHLCEEVFTDRVIVFFRQKKEAHRVRVIFALLGLKAAELHGSMSQEQRIAAISSFTSQTATHLLATDLASRGLDIPKVSTVINYSAPQSHEIYLHRVGRTARAGRLGRACTLAAEPDRKVVRQAVKTGREQGAKIVSRVVENASVDSWMARVAELEPEIESILQEEKEEKLLNASDMQIRKSENIIDHEAEIKSRPKRTWFESEKEKLLSKKKGLVELNGDVGLRAQGKKGKKGGKLSGKEKKALDDRRDRVEGRSWKKGKADRASKGPKRPKPASGKITKPKRRRK